MSGFARAIWLKSAVVTNIVVIACCANRGRQFVGGECDFLGYADQACTIQESAPDLKGRCVKCGIRGEGHAVVRGELHIVGVQNQAGDARCGIWIPLGIPVEPEVYMT